MNLLELVLASSLGFEIPSRFVTKQIPSDTFGVFATIRRSPAFARKTWPKDIHGCIGYYDKLFRTQSQNVIYSQLLKVSHDAVWEDSRNKYFPNIFFDPSALLEIDFMQQPVQEISSTGRLQLTHEPFDNARYGVIVVANDGTATYLPKVFDALEKKEDVQTYWNRIRDSLIDKAGTQQEGKFYAYEIKQVSGPLFTLVAEPGYLKWILDTSRQKILQIIEQSGSIPYEVTDNKITYDKNEDVRNAGTIATLMCTAPNDQSSSLLALQKEFIKDHHLSLQASSFILQSLACKKRYPQDFVDRVVSKSIIDFSSLDSDFGQPEMLLALRNVASLRPDSKLRAFLEFHVKKLKRDILSPIKLHDIFRLNWQVQVLDQYLSDTEKLFILQRVNTLCQKTKLSDLETNYLAVLFELFCHLVINRSSSKQISWFFTTFAFLQSRYHRGLYNFIESTTARIDLTCHVMDGIYYLNTNYSGKPTTARRTYSLFGSFR